MLREEAEEAVRDPKAGKSTGVDNIPSDLFKNGGETTPTVLTVICQKIRETKERTKEWTQSLVKPLRHLQQCKNYRTIILISHPSKIMFRVILNRPKARAEELLAEDQAGFSAIELIFNSRVITEKHLQYQRDLFNNFIDFKKACDGVWHVGLWQVLRSFNMHEGLVQAI